MLVVSWQQSTVNSQQSTQLTVNSQQSVGAVDGAGPPSSRQQSLLVDNDLFGQ
ncbi:hypothetical protein [Tychonema sp. LEGE 07203]|uniref:hypothetical protein n=1 Tax=Tychonema sp. LEGE 07203 TaxID=1828671 RepID=UPI001881820D|nr:hypothetical protein [Tychonema sp. LEGE 07203]MBE9096613.1 hypothetical protein [Tychonema sp. LEGE 07203]